MSIEQRGAFRSLYDNQLDILDAIRVMHCPEGFDADITFGNGSFWSRQDRPAHCYDIDPVVDGVAPACSTDIPHSDSSLGSVVFDPPFLTYVRSGRGGNGSMVMSRRFGGYWTYQELEAHYRGTLSECARVIRPGGILTFKCQDIVHNHRLHPTHAFVVEWARAAGFWLKDMFILGASHRLPSPNRAGTQRHARIFHSYFLVFCRMTSAQEQNPLVGLSIDREQNGTKT